MSKTHVVILHGTMGSPEGNWFPWLRANLETRGVKTIVPSLPGPDTQSLKTWTHAFRDQVGKLSATSILVGHSTGALLAMRLLEERHTPLRSCYLICPFAEPLGNPVFDPLNHSFISPPFEWNRVSNGSTSITVYAGDNDPYVPLSLSASVAEQVGAKIHVIPGGGHLNADSGYTQFDELLAEIGEELTKS